VLEQAHNALEATKEYLSVEPKRKLAHGALLLTLGASTTGFALMSDSKKAYAANSPQYTVSANASGGIYSRNTPNWNDTPRIPGQGIYQNDVLTLECGVTDGTPVGQYNNTTWYFVQDDSRNELDFWVPDHYMNTPNAPDQLAPGVITCPNEGTDPMADNTSSSAPAYPDTPYFAGACQGSPGAALLGSAQGGYDDIPGSEEWSQEMSNDPNADICVGAMVASPDYSNHTQFIGRVESGAPDLDPSGCSLAYEVEIWG